VSHTLAACQVKHWLTPRRLGAPSLRCARVGNLTLTFRTFNDLRFHSNANKKVIDKQCTFMLFYRVFAATQPRTVLTSLPSACTPPRGSNARRNAFRISTYEISRKCCKQRTCRIAKSFRCNTYKKQGGGGVMRIRQRMRILSDHRELKDSSPAPLFTRSLHKERFTTLLESNASKLFLEIAGCIPTIPILKLNSRSLKTMSPDACRVK